MSEVNLNNIIIFQTLYVSFVGPTSRLYLAGFMIQHISKWVRIEKSYSKWNQNWIGFFFIDGGQAFNEVL